MSVTIAANGILSQNVITDNVLRGVVDGHGSVPFVTAYFLTNPIIAHIELINLIRT